MSKIDSKVDKIGARLDQLEIKIKTMDTRVGGVEDSCSFISKQYEEQKKNVAEASKQVADITQHCEKLEEKTTFLGKEKDRLESKLLDLESRSMRENLLFMGIPERENEDCSRSITEFCTDYLHMDSSSVDKVVIDRAHRLGARRDGKVRPVVVKFHRYGDRETIRQKGVELREELKRSNRAVKPQWPKEMTDRRKKLYPIMDAERQKGNRVQLVKDKLFINGSEYKPV